MTYSFIVGLCLVIFLGLAYRGVISLSLNLKSIVIVSSVSKIYIIFGLCHRKPSYELNNVHSKTEESWAKTTMVVSVVQTNLITDRN